MLGGGAGEGFSSGSQAGEMGFASLPPLSPWEWWGATDGLHKHSLICHANEG